MGTDLRGRPRARCTRLAAYGFVWTLVLALALGACGSGSDAPPAGDTTPAAQNEPPPDDGAPPPGPTAPSDTPDPGTNTPPPATEPPPDPPPPNPPLPPVPLLFWAQDELHGREPWITDGTVAGTRLLKDLNPDTNSSMSGSSARFVRIGARVYFDADSDGDGYTELWQTDGTAETTTPVLDSAGKGIRWPTLLRVFDGVLYFAADRNSGLVSEVPSYAAELWQSDGTAAGTHAVPYGDGGTMTGVSNIVVGADALYVAADPGGNGTQLFRVTASAITEVQRLVDTTPVAMGPVEGLTWAAGALYFSRPDDALGFELWKSEGTTAGTALLADLFPGSGDFGVYSSYPGDFVGLGDKVLFLAEDSTYGREPWVTDGTATGTLRLADINAGIYSADVREITIVGALAYFAADHATYGRELWQTDGTVAGTQLVADIDPNVEGSGPRTLLAAGSRLFFLEDDGSGQRLHVTDGGTPQAISPVLGAFSCSAALGTVGAKAVFALTSESGVIEFWVSDGTAPGTLRLTDQANQNFICG